MQSSMRKKKLKLYEILFRSALLFLILILVTSYIASGVLAKYTSTAVTNESARVAKFGDVNLYEYTAEGNVLVSGETSQVENITISAGIDIPKNLTISFSGSEVLSYVFFVVESNGWKINVDNNDINYKLSIENNKEEYLIKWTLNENWKYLSNISTENKSIFYHEIQPNKNFENKLMNEFEVNAIGLDDVELMKEYGHDISFKAYATSAVEITPENAFVRIEETI